MRMDPWQEDQTARIINFILKWREVELQNPDKMILNPGDFNGHAERRIEGVEESAKKC